MANILIVGGGVAGLSAGIYSVKAGHQVTILECHTALGGNLTGWDRGICHIDNCIHWLTGTNPATQTYHMWEDLGALGDVEVIRNDTLFTSRLGKRSVSLLRDLQESEAQMLSLSPADRIEIRSFWDAVRAMEGFCGTKGTSHNERNSLGESLLALPGMIKYFLLSTGALAARFRDPLLRCFFTDILGQNFSALALVIVAATFCSGNGDIPKGGSRAMANRMSERFLSLGGRVYTGMCVEEILLTNGHATGVRCTNGEHYQADYVILTVDPKTVFDGKMLPLPMPRALEKRYRNPKYMRFSAIQSAFLWEGEDPPFRGDVTFDVPPDLCNILGIKRLTVREFSHEKDFAPPGKTLLQTITPLPEHEAKRWIEARRDPVCYAEKKRLFAKAIQAALEEGFGSFSPRFIPIDIWTPATYQRFTHSDIGSFMSFTLPPLTIPHRLSAVIDGAENIFLATQWQKMPGGLPIAAEAGKYAATLVTQAEARRPFVRRKKKSYIKGNI